MRLKIVGKNPLAGGSECVIFGHVGRRDGKFAPIGPQAPGDSSLAARGRWRLREMKPGAGLNSATALVGWREQEDSCRIDGRIVLVSHNWSGVLQINDIGRKYIVDLYAQETSLVLLDLVHGILVDVTELAAVEGGVLVLPDLTVPRLVRHIVEGYAGFRFLEREPFAPGLARRLLEALRRRPDETLKHRLLAALLPALAARPQAEPPAAPDPSLRDEMRLLAAAVEGLALRMSADA